MGEVDFTNKDDDYKVKIVDGGEYKEPGGAIRKPSQEEIDAYGPHRIVVMIIFGLVVAVLLLVVVILIATIDRCEPEPKVKKLPWWKGGVMYNVYPRSFKDSDKNGVGDFKGIIAKLDYIKKLGVEILYLSSIFKVDNAVDYGYAVKDYKDTNEQYGSLKTFENLVKTAHEKDIKVVIEFVPFDTSIQHQWFIDSENVTGSKRDWYIWRNAVKTVNSSTNAPSDQIWANDTTGKFQYLHRKGEKQLANLNWGNANVQKELESVLGFWLDKGVDGFRVVPVRDYLSKPPLSNDLSKLHNLLNKWHNYTTKKNAGNVLIGSSVPPNLSYYGSESLPEFDIMMNFELVPDNMQTFYTASNFKKLIENYIGNLPNGMWPSWVLTSWKHKRVGSNVDAKLAKSLNALLLTLPGTPVVFYGDEIGMKDVSGTTNPDNHSPMQWSTGKNAGFSEASSTWFGSVGNSSYANVKDDPQKILEIFKKAVKLRSENKLGFLDGSLTANFTIKNENDVLIYTFKSEPKPRFVVAINFGTSEKTVDLNEVGVKKGDLKLYTSDTKPNAMDMNEVKIPSMALFVYQITENVD